MDNNWSRKIEELRNLLKRENIDPYEDKGCNNREWS